MCDLQSAVKAAEASTVAGIKSGEAIGFRAGMLHAAKMADERAKLHAKHLPRDHYYLDGDLAQAATCGRRDECNALAYVIRKTLTEATK